MSPVPASVVTWSPPHVSVPLLFSGGHQSLGLGPTPHPGCFHLKTYNPMTSAKTPFPSEIAFPGRGRGLGHSFWGPHGIRMGGGRYRGE